MISLDNKAYFWQEFDDDNNPIDPKECQILFNPNSGGRLTYLMDIGTDFLYDEHKDEKIKICYGQVKNGEKFTLLNLAFKEFNLEGKFKGLSLVELDYSIEYIFYGTWMKESDFKLSVIHLRYSYLEAWFEQMEVVGPYDNDDKSILEIIVHKESLLDSTKDYEVIFNINNEFNLHSNSCNTVVYDLKNFLAMARRGQFNLNEAKTLSLKVKSFFEILTFYSQRKIFIEEVRIYKDEIIGDYLTTETVYVLFKQEGYKKEEEISSRDFLFTYAAIRENFAEVLNHWIDNYDINRNEFGAFCNVISDKNSKFNIYSHFFQLVSALEGYDRKNSIVNEDFAKKKKIYEKRLNYKRISDLHKKKFKNIILELQNRNEQNFRARLKRLIELSDIKSIINLSNSQHKSIANLIYNTRNDIAHSKKNIIINEKMKYAYEYLKLVALLIMIKDISLNHSSFSEHIFDINFQHLENNLKKAFRRR